MDAVSVEPAQVFAYRALRHDLDSQGAEPETLGALETGLQDTPPGSALLAVRARTGVDDPERLRAALWPAGPLVLLWSVRGAAHLHHEDDLGLLAAGLRPAGHADAMGRLLAYGTELEAAGIEPDDAVDTIAGHMREIVTGPTPKGDLSGQVAGHLPRVLAPWCEGCGVFHPQDQIFRLAAVRAGLVIDPGAKGVVFRPFGGPVAEVEPDEARRELVRRLVRRLGPTAPAGLADWIGSRPGPVRALWDLVADELVPVKAGGRKAWILEADLDALRTAPEPERVRLLPPGDVLLRGWDKKLLVPEQALRSKVWKPAGAPGVVLARGEVAGIWRPRANGARLTITVIAFRRLSASERAEAGREAAAIGAVRGAKDVTVVHEDA
ncbi:crosslink repair DNA glycosylase YcaQ family protein [Spirillospora sp. NPDC047279]|uniref:DNA glycosylase AlkZ-like family protein n=1 Tax=Spirillospora sp. NPDC047279 TaxID=3155478 RepID=UPI0033E59DBD